MGWSIGWCHKTKRDIGYGVPAICDHPKCNAEIDRGLSYVCGGAPYGGEHGCGLFFCPEHLGDRERDGKYVQLCSRCRTGHKPAPIKPDTKEWINHKLTDETWDEWRNENKDEVEILRQYLTVIDRDASAR